MKPQYIKNKTAQRLRDGFHTDLMAIFEESIDLYTEKNFNRGHDSFFEDASIHAYRIAEQICNHFDAYGIKLTFIPKATGYDAFDTEDLAKVIEDYFNSIKPNNEG